MPLRDYFMLLFRRVGTEYMIKLMPTHTALMFYFNFSSEQEIKQRCSNKENSEKNSQVEIDCQLADKSHELLLGKKGFTPGIRQKTTSFFNLYMLIKKYE
jgi:hypothetical protein